MKLIKKAINNYSARLPKLFFLHIAKCGGISINRSLRWKYIGHYHRVNSKASVESALQKNGIGHPYDDYYASVHSFRDDILRYEMNSGGRFISGHYAYNHEIHNTIGRDYVHMTILRDPVDRFLSSFYFNKNKSNDSPWKINASLKEYLDTNTAKYHGMDYVRLLAGVPYLDENVEVQLEKAKEHLEKFDIVGVIEDSNKIELAIKNNLSLNVKIGHKNKTKKRRRIEDLDTKFKNKITEICRPNVQIYNHVIEVIK